VELELNRQPQSHAKLSVNYCFQLLVPFHNKAAYLMDKQKKLSSISHDLSVYPALEAYDGRHQTLRNPYQFSEHNCHKRT
jgi:hypothetical protein